MLARAALLALAVSLLVTPVHFRRAHATAPPAAVPAPEDVLGFRPGDDRRLASWSQVVEYFRRLDAASDRVRFEELGKTTLGAPFVMATISAPENLARLEEYREIQRQLADPRTLGRGADAKAAQLVRRGKSVVLITCGVHSTEVGSYLSSMLIAHRLASSDDPLVRGILRDTIVLLVPSLNPDGVDIVKNWYDRTLGTPYEGTGPPELYHHYVGHDDNRDWYAFTQIETQLTVDKVHNAWRPHIVHDIHQQGAAGSRLFLPPYMKPVEPNVPRQLVEGYTELGLSMAKNLLAAGFRGITWDSTYDAWTPARAYSHYHGGVRILSETASARLATPVNMKFEELRSREGYDPQKPSPNFPAPWPGGEWRLRDITNYMTAAAFELLKHASQNREAWLRRFYSVGREAVRPRRPGELQGFWLRPLGNSADGLLDLISILERGGVEVNDARPAAARRGSDSDTFVRMAQPYGAFAKALLETQTYPDLRDEAGRPVPPYDVTAHTLPLLMGVEAEPVYAPVRLEGPSTFVGIFLPPAEAGARRPRVGLYKSYVPSMDEGWTRWIFEKYMKLPYSSLQDGEVRRGNLREKFDAIVIPDQSARAILEGHRKGTMPEEFTGGLGEEGVKALREFVRAGGTLVCLNEASRFAIEQLDLPVRDVTENLKRTEFYAPGSILRTELDTSHPLARGMPRQSVAWVEDSPVFEIKSDPLALVRVKIVARYPDSGTPLLSGWLLGGERIRGRAALVEVGLGEGRVYLFGFRPQYRAQSLATYPLLFNALGAPR
ncbi:MAG TPA: M14 family zinc carboxypeptidase [Pyrinomonadaceae bacterium]|nr:M14 family zinc carboxypeptidase [Pyrinomonadaceae bacterium]